MNKWKQVIKAIGFFETCWGGWEYENNRNVDYEVEMYDWHVYSYHMSLSPSLSLPPSLSVLSAGYSIPGILMWPFYDGHLDYPFHFAFHFFSMHINKLPIFDK